MNLEEIKKIEKKTLIRLEDSFKEELIPANFIPSNDEFPYDVLDLIVHDLGTSHEEVIGEACFINPDEKNEIHTFTCVCTLLDDLKEENIDKLYEAVTDLNFYIPYGAFALSKKAKMLIYKIAAPISASLDEEQLFIQTQALIGNGFLVVDKYVSLLLDVNEGKDIELIRELTEEN